jgi:hypothetical protein
LDLSWKAVHAKAGAGMLRATAAATAAKAFGKVRIEKQDPDGAGTRQEK